MAAAKKKIAPPPLDTPARVLARESAHPPGTMVLQDPVLGLSWSPDGCYLIAASFDRHVEVWDAAGPLPRGTGLASLAAVTGGPSERGFGVDSGVVCWKAVASAQRILAAGFGDKTVRLWDLGSEEEEPLRTIPTPGGIVASLEFSRDGQKLLLGNCGDKTVRLMDVATGRELCCGRTKKSGSWFVSLSPDASRAVSGAADKLVHVWDLSNGREIGALSGHGSRINGLGFFPDGKKVASASSDRTVRIWDVEKGSPLAECDGHEKAVMSVAVSPDGHTLVSGGLDDRVILWNAASGKQKKRYAVPRGAAACVAFAPDGREVCSAGSDGALRVWPV